MSRDLLKIFSSELVLVSLSFQIFFGAVPYMSAANPTLHESIQTHSAVDGYAFDMEGTTYLAIGNALSGNPATIIQPQASGPSLSLQDLPDSASDFEYFTISGESYLAVAHNYIDDAVYKFDGSSFTGFQILPSNIQATAFEFVSFSGGQYLAVANASYSDYSKILEWTGTGFSSTFDIGAIGGVTDIETFEVKNIETWEYPSNVYLPYAELLADYSIISSGSVTEQLLAEKMTRAEFSEIVARVGGYTSIACQGNIYTDVDSNISECGYIETLVTAGVLDAHPEFNPGAYITKIDVVKMLLRTLGENPSANQTPYTDLAEFDSNTIGYATRANELNWTATDTEFVPYYTMTRGQLYMFIAGLVGGSISRFGVVSSSGTYVALSDGKVYSLSSSGIALIQDLGIMTPADVQFVKDGYEQYLIYLSHGGAELLVYRWNGIQFDLVDTNIGLQTSGGTKLGFDTFISKGKTYLIMSKSDDDSMIYVFNNTHLEEYQAISLIQPGNTELHASWTQFKLGAKQMLFLANSFNTNDSYILEWSEVPYVVVDGPVSGESYTSNIWDPAVTPIVGHGNPNMPIAIYDGNGVSLGTGTTDARGDFSITTTASSGSVLPIRVVPYSGALIGDEKTIQYLDIRPTPLPTASRASGAFNTGFTLTISGESPYYSTGNSIAYEVYEEGVFTISGEFFGSQDIAIPAKNTSVEFRGVNTAGVSTTRQVREFYYDTTAPTLAHDVPYTLAPVQSMNHTVTDVGPEITQTIYNEHVSRIRIANTSQTTSIYLNQIALFIRPQEGMAYSGTICLRVVGSTSNCDSYDTSSGVNLVPGLNTLNFNIPGDSNTIIPGGYGEYEIRSDLTYILVPNSIVQTDIIGLDYRTNYATSVASIYLGANNPNSLYTVGGPIVSGTIQPTNTTTFLDTYFVTGSLAQIEIETYDDGIYFGGDEDDILPQFGDILSGAVASYVYVGNHGVIKSVSGNKDISVGTNMVNYSSTDNVGNNTEKTIVIYRIPEITMPSIGYSGSAVYAAFESDATVSGEYQYATTDGQAHSGTMVVYPGVNSMILTGVTLSGTVDFTVGVQKNLSGMILPDVVYNAVRQNISYTFDATPTVFAIPLRTSIPLDQVVEYGPYTLSGFNVPLITTVSTGAISINGGAYTTSSVTVYSGDIIRIQSTSPSAYSTTKSGILTIGSLSILYALETLMAPPIITLPTVPVSAGPGGGGGGGSSPGSVGVSIISASSSSSNNRSSVIQGLLFNIIGDKTQSSQSTSNSSLMSTVKVLAQSYMGTIEKEINTLSDTAEKVETLNRSIKSYTKKMTESRILSPEYLVYRKIKQNLTQFKKSLF